jgi:hypothetical protein
MDSSRDSYDRGCVGNHKLLRQRREVPPLSRVRLREIGQRSRLDRCTLRDSYLRSLCSSVCENLFRPSYLKLLAIALAIGSGILEEVMFRRWTMNWLMAHGYGAVVQVLGAGLLFGAVHGVWGLMGKSFRAAIGATVATGFLGIMLGIVFLLAGRSLAPCIVAHFVINLLIEPGLVLAAARGEMGSVRVKHAEIAVPNE